MHSLTLWKDGLKRLERTCKVGRVERSASLSAALLAQKAQVGGRTRGGGGREGGWRVNGDACRAMKASRLVMPCLQRRSRATFPPIPSSSLLPPLPSGVGEVIKGWDVGVEGVCLPLNAQEDASSWKRLKLFPCPPLTLLHACRHSPSLAHERNDQSWRVHILSMAFHRALSGAAP